MQRYGRIDLGYAQDMYLAEIAAIVIGAFPNQGGLWCRRKLLAQTHERPDKGSHGNARCVNASRLCILDFGFGQGKHLVALKAHILQFAVPNICKAHLAALRAKPLCIRFQKQRFAVVRFLRKHGNQSKWLIFIRAKRDSAGIPTARHSHEQAVFAFSQIRAQGIAIKKRSFAIHNRTGLHFVVYRLAVVDCANALPIAVNVIAAKRPNVKRRLQRKLCNFKIANKKKLTARIGMIANSFCKALVLIRPRVVGQNFFCINGKWCHNKIGNFREISEHSSLRL